MPLRLSGGTLRAGKGLEARTQTGESISIPACWFSGQTGRIFPCRDGVPTPGGVQEMAGSGTQCSGLGVKVVKEGKGWSCWPWRSFPPLVLLWFVLSSESVCSPITIHIWTLLWGETIATFLWLSATLAIPVPQVLHKYWWKCLQEKASTTTGIFCLRTEVTKVSPDM